MPTKYVLSLLMALAAVILLGCSQSEPATPKPALATAVSPNPTTGATDAGLWIPSPKTGWQWQLNVLPIDQSIDVEMYDIDLFDNDADMVAALHAQGRKVVCYVNVGG